MIQFTSKGEMYLVLRTSYLVHKIPFNHKPDRENKQKDAKFQNGNRKPNSGKGHT